MTAGCEEEYTFLAPPKASDELGRLGSYRVLKLLGQGGMGMVFLAEDPHLQRTVALKAMLPELAKRTGAKERFLRKARATAKIEHDNIVTIFQVGEDRGVPFLAMQMLKGMSLGDFLQKKQGNKAGSTLRLDQIVKLGREIARGLAAAHEQGLIHRDIKAANIWLDASAGGRVKILDFGLARPSEGSAQITQSGMIVGTAAYMAPEQARGGSIDARVDLFSLGCVLYRLCTGRHPWNAEDLVGMLLAVATEVPTPVLELNPNLPPKLAELVERLLAKKPADRPASAKVVVEALQAIERGQPALSMTIPSPPTPDLTLTNFEPMAAEPRSKFLTLTRRAWLIVILVFGSFAGITALSLAAGILYFHTNTGTLQLETTHEDVQVIVEQNGKQIDVLDKNNDMKVTLYSGEYLLRLPEDSKNLKLDADRIQITRNGAAVVTLRDVSQPTTDRPKERDPRSDRPHRQPGPRKKR